MTDPLLRCRNVDLDFVFREILYISVQGFYDGHIPCPNAENLMATAVGPETTTWSECTRNMIDHHYDKMVAEGKDCTYT